MAPMPMNATARRCRPRSAASGVAVWPSFLTPEQTDRVVARVRLQLELGAGAGVFRATVHQIGRRHVLDGHAERLEDRDLVAARRPATRPSSTSPSSPATCAASKRPSRMPCTTSPDSTRAAARESTTSRPRATSAGAISRWSGRQAPTEITCAPGATQASSTTGVGDDVTSTTMSAPSHGVLGRRAGADRRAARPAMSATKRSRLRGCGLHTRTSLSGRTSASASRWLRAWTPVPMMASRRRVGREIAWPTPPRPRPSAPR